jgi:H+/Cl- antiporter ClcA
MVFAALLVCATVSYAISNGAFYWLGGRYTNTNMTQYAQRFMQWAPLFVRAAAAYVLAAQVIHAVVRRFAPQAQGAGTTHA